MLKPIHAITYGFSPTCGRYLGNVRVGSVGLIYNRVVLPMMGKVRGSQYIMYTEQYTTVIL